MAVFNARFACARVAPHLAAELELERSAVCSGPESLPGRPETQPTCPRSSNVSATSATASPACAAASNSRTSYLWGWPSAALLPSYWAGSSGCTGASYRDMTPAFERWLREHVTSADRRAALAEAADGLVDMYNAERDELEDVLTISAWPAFARNRFLRAWQALRDAGRAVALAADEGTAELVLRPTAGAANRPAAGAAPEEGHGPPTALGVQSLGASAGLAGAPRPELTERVRVVAKTDAASPGIAALHYGRTGVVTKRTPAWNYVQLDATRYKRSETIPCRNRDLVLIPRQTPANPELPHALAVLGRGAPGAPGIDDDDDNEDDADANAGTQLDLDVVTDDADGGADEQGLVLAGCNGALFPVSGQVQAASALGAGAASAMLGARPGGVVAVGQVRGRRARVKLQKLNLFTGARTFATRNPLADARIRFASLSSLRD